MTPFISLAILILVAALSYRRIEFMLALLMVGQPVLSYGLSLGQGSSIERGGNSWIHMAVMGFILVCVSQFILTRKGTFRYTKSLGVLLTAIVVEVGLLALQIFPSSDREYGKEKLLFHCVYEITAFVIPFLTLRSIGQVRAFLWSCSVLGAVTAALLFLFMWENYGNLMVQLRLPQEVMIFHGFRLPTALTLGYRQSIVACGALGLFYLQPKDRLAPRLFLAMVAAASFWLVVLSATRAATAMLIFIAIVLSLAGTKTWASRLIGACLCLVFMVLVFQVTPSAIQDRFYNTSLDERTMIWSFSLNLSLNNFLTGVGLGGYGLYEIGAGHRTYSHNLLLEYLTETGIVGLILISSILLIALWRAKDILVSSSQRIAALTVTGIFLVGCGSAMVAGAIGSVEILWSSIGILFSPAFLQPRVASMWGSSQLSIARSERLRGPQRVA